MQHLIKKINIIFIIALMAFAVIACDSNDDEDKTSTTTFVNEGTATAPVALTLNAPYSGQVSDGNDTDVCLNSYYEIAITPGLACTITLSDIDEFDDDQNRVDVLVRDKQETDPNIYLKPSTTDANGNKVIQLLASETTNINTLGVKVKHCTYEGKGGDFTLLVQQ